MSDHAITFIAPTFHFSFAMHFASAIPNQAPQTQQEVMDSEGNNLQPTKRADAITNEEMWMSFV